MSNFFSSVEIASGEADVETPLILVQNPTESGVAFLNLEFGVTLFDNSDSAIFRIYINPSVTDTGSLLVIGTQLQGDTLTSQMLVSTNPIISSNGLLAKHFSIASNTTIPDLDLVNFGMEGGFSFLITCVSHAPSVGLAVDLFWEES